MSKTIAHLDMDAFFAAVEQRDNPSLKGKPVVIGADPQGGHGRGVVSTCSYEARPFGIRSALPISKAYQLCPNAVFLRGSHAKYRAVSKEIFAILHHFTPTVEPISIDEAFLDISGCFRTYGGPSGLAMAIKKRIREEVGLNASIGIAPVKMVAKIASDYCKPDGLLEIKPEGVLDFLWPLTIGKIWGVGQKMQAALHELNIHTVKDLAQYPQDKLIERFGSYGKKLHRLANGIDEREVSSEEEEAKSVSHEHTFEVDTNDVHLLHEQLLYLSQKVSRRLRQYQLKGKTVSIKVRTSDFKTVTRAVTLSQRVCFDDVIYQESKKLFDAYFKSFMRIRLIGVRVSHFEDLYVQESLFAEPENEKKESMYKAIDQIQDKFGDGAIRSGVVEGKKYQQ